MKIKLAVMLGIAGLAGTVTLASARNARTEVDEQAVRAVIDARLHQVLTEQILARAGADSHSAQ